MLSINRSALLFIDKCKNRAWDSQPSPGTDVAMKDKAAKCETYNKDKKQDVKSIVRTLKLPQLSDTIQKHQEVYSVPAIKYSGRRERRSPSAHWFCRVDLHASKDAERNLIQSKSKTEVRLTTGRISRLMPITIRIARCRWYVEYFSMTLAWSSWKLVMKSLSHKKKIYSFTREKTLQAEWKLNSYAEAVKTPSRHCFSTQHVHT